MALKHLVLGVLAAGEANGYAVGGRLAALPGIGRPIDSARVYALLAGLERDGLVIARLEPVPRRPPRRLFSLAAAGRVALDRWLDSPAGPVELLGRSIVVRLAAAGPGISGAALRTDLESRRRLQWELRAAGSSRAAARFERLCELRLERRLAVEVDLLLEVLGASEGTPELRPRGPSG